MNRLFIFLILKMVFSITLPLRKVFIKNVNLPICANCKYFIEDKNKISGYAKCKKFGTIDIISGILKYEYAEFCRDDKEKCGMYGSEYEENTVPPLPLPF